MKILYSLLFICLIQSININAKKDRHKYRGKYDRRELRALMKKHQPQQEGPPALMKKHQPQQEGPPKEKKFLKYTRDEILVLERKKDGDLDPEVAALTTLLRIAKENTCG